MPRRLAPLGCLRAQQYRSPLRGTPAEEGPGQGLPTGAVPYRPDVDSRSTRRSDLPATGGAATEVRTVVIAVADRLGLPSPVPSTTKRGAADAISPKRAARRPSHEKRRTQFIEQAVAIEQTSAQESGMLGYMARVLVQATMPHRATPARQFRRTNGELTVTITALGDFPLPYGTYPRLLLAWLATEAVREKTREIVLGDSLTQFMQKLGLLATGGKWGTIPRFKQATMSLFSAAIACFREHQDGPAKREQGKLLHVADEFDLWWTPTKRHPDALWHSTVSLSETFFREIVDRPVPVDLRAIKALKQSPMALDLYSWLTYRMSYLKRPTEIPWGLLRMQFGAGYTDTPKGRYKFREGLLEALNRVSTVYAGLKAREGDHGLKLLPGRPHVSRRPHAPHA
jgi:hypothetical protein